MKKKIVAIVIIGVFLLTSVSSISVVGSNIINGNSAKTIYVDDDAPPEWYDETHVKTIPEGITVAEDGDTVFVFNGNYEEYYGFTIDKSIDLIGEDKYLTIINTWAHVEITDVDGLKMSGFKLKLGTGLCMYGCFNCIVQDNIVEPRQVWGIYLSQSSHNTIMGNTITKCGIELQTSANNNIISDNDITNGEIYLGGGNHNIIFNNTVKKIDMWRGSNIIDNNTITGDGIDVHSSNNVITGNTISNLDCGWLTTAIDVYSCNNTISGNTISNINADSAAIGIIIFDPNNIISGNMISNINAGCCALGIDTIASSTVISGNIISNIHGGQSAYGVEFGGTDTTITRNEFSNIDGDCISVWSSGNKIIANNFTNSKKGVDIGHGSNNLIYNNNFINNNENAYNAGNNQWYNDYTKVGNYWDDYTGKDSNGDGIGDTPYKIPGFGPKVDRYPLMKPYPNVKSHTQNSLLPNTLFMRLFERFPNAFPILRRILGL